MRSAALGSLFLCACVSLSAATLTVSFSGTYSATTPATAWTAPNATYSVTFNVNSNPTPNSYVTGSDFDAPVTNLIYTLNGNVVNVGTVDVAFYNLGLGGLIDVGFFGSAATNTPLNGFELLGPQAYSGPEAAPTILPGAYTETRNTLYVASGPNAQTVGNVSITVGPTPTPAPPSLLLAMAGFGVVIAYLVSRRLARS